MWQTFKIKKLNHVFKIVTIGAAKSISELDFRDRDVLRDKTFRKEGKRTQESSNVEYEMDAGSQHTDHFCEQ